VRKMAIQWCQGARQDRRPARQRNGSEGTRHGPSKAGEKREASTSSRGGEGGGEGDGRRATEAQQEASAVAADETGVHRREAEEAAMVSKETRKWRYGEREENRGRAVRKGNTD